MSRIHPVVAVVNACTVLPDADIRYAAGALQKQVTRDFAPAWGVSATLKFVPKGTQPPADAWWLVYLDNSDEAGALGYHDLTPGGLPIGKVFAGTDERYGLSHSVTASHELLEMLGDPYINLTVEGEDGAFYAFENADAVEADELGYVVDGVKVSDFVWPRYFDPTAKGSITRLDQCHHVSRPFQILPGGYLSRWTPQGGWTQQHGSDPAPGDRARVGSRRERRRTPRVEWLRSTA